MVTYVYVNMKKSSYCLLVAGVGIILVCLFVAYGEHFERKEMGAAMSLSVADEILTRFKDVDNQDAYIQTKTTGWENGKHYSRTKPIPITSIGTLKSDIRIEKHGLMWNNGDGYTIYISPTESFELIKPVEECVWNDVPNLFRQEIDIAQQLFADRGFVLDTANSFTNLSGDSLYDYVQAYRKNDTLCKITANSDCTIYGYHEGNEWHSHALITSCGNTFTEAHRERVPLLNALDLKNIYAAAVVKNQSGPFLELSVISGTRGGGTAIIKKEGDQYRVLYQGQETPPCTLIDKEKIPNEVLTSIGNGVSCSDEFGEREDRG